VPYAHVKFAHGKKRFPIYPQDQINVGPRRCLGFLTDNFGDHGYLFGDTFLKNVLTIHQWEPKRIGFATLNEHGYREIDPEVLASLQSKPTLPAPAPAAAAATDAAAAEPVAEAAPTAAAAETPADADADAADDAGAASAAPSA
jgi:hypothetical protein